MTTRRRFEILLPLQFNDGRGVPESLLWETMEELEQRFGALSWENQAVRGLWRYEGATFRDNNTRIILDVEDSPENRAFFAAFKAKLKDRFQQIDIWITSHLIDVV